MHAAKARSIAELIVDTAGRLHTKTGLMDELDKMRRTAAVSSRRTHEVLLVMDATTARTPAAGPPVHPIGRRHRHHPHQLDAQPRAASP